MTQGRPNLIYILADDMGYGDLGCNNPDSKIPTPNLDRLAAQGMRFTDAHAGSSICTPSRYSVLTGRYAWRSRLKHGIVWEWDGPLIEPDRPTVASMLRGQGYRTACLGKWHLGWDWPTLDGTRPNETLSFGERELDGRRELGLTNIDYTKRIPGGPLDCGFDSYFGVDVPNFAPYTWFDDDRLTDAPTEEKPTTMYGNPGLAAAGWKLERMIPEFTRRAVELIEAQGAVPEGDEPAPYFLYFPLTSPHSPIVPNEEFHGRSGAGRYGDFVCEVDWVVGQIMDALERTGARDNTLLVFTATMAPKTAHLTTRACTSGPSTASLQHGTAAGSQARRLGGRPSSPLCGVMARLDTPGKPLRSADRSRGLDGHLRRDDRDRAAGGRGRGQRQHPAVAAGRYGYAGARVCHTPQRFREVRRPQGGLGLHRRAQR